MYKAKVSAIIPQNIVFIVILFIQNALLFTPSSISSAEPPLSAGNSIWTSNNEDSWNYWWTYSGVSGPEYWGLINLDWYMCDKGQKQSPINIETKKLVYDPRLTGLKVDSNLISGLLYNDGHAIVLNCSTSAMFQASKIEQTTHQIKDKQYNAESRINNRTKRYIVDSLDGLFNEKSPPEQEHSSNSNSAGPLKELSNSIDLSINQTVDGMLLQSNSMPASSNIDFSLTGSASSLDDMPSFEEMSNTQKIQVSGGGLPYDYKFEALYIRFGLDDSGGSEHKINSKSFPGELQLMCYNSLLYKSFYDASSKPNGILGISILLDIVSTDDDNGTKKADNEPLGVLLKHVTQIKFRGEMAPIREFNLSALLPEREHFVSYDGSLTTPGCYESVNWILLNKPLYISQSNLNLLRSMSADERVGSSTGTIIANNYRPTQVTNNRLIRTNIKPTVNKSDSQNPEACRKHWTKYEYKDSITNKDK